MQRRLLVLLLAAATLLSACVLSACGSGDQHNAQDVSFATEMIPHHVQAVEMAKLASAQSQNDQIKTLAVQIQNAQQPEIDVMNGWLRKWGEPEVGTTATMDHSAGGSGSMMSSGEMAQLMVATGPAFDRLFINGMVKHHTGAVAMAQTELSGGQFGPAKTLARSIAKSQQAEIATMKSLSVQG